MTEFIEILDASDNRITELSTLDSLRYFSGLNFRTLAGRGYGDGSFQIKRNIAEYLAIKLAYRVKVWNDGKLIYEGRIREIGKSLRGVDETITIPMVGFYSVLESRVFRWRYADNAVVSRMFERDSRLTNSDQNRLDSFYQKNIIRVRGGFDDTSRAGTESFRLRYPVSPISGNYIERMTYDIHMRSGEGVEIELWNVDQAASETTNSTSTGSVVDTPVDHTLTQGDTGGIGLRFKLTSANLYDENDRMQVHDPVAYYDLPSFGSPNYYADEIIQDILERKATDISSDYDDLESPSLAIIPFTIEEPTAVSRSIEKLARFGDSNDDTWGFFVWDSFGTSDDKPKAQLTQRPATTDWEYEARLADLVDFDDSESTDAIRNYIYLRYVDKDGITRYLNPDDDSALKDQDSIDTYGQRDHFEDVGKSDTATATQIGTRRLAYRKDPKRKISFGVQGTVRSKQGIPIPVSQIRAWERIKILDYNDGEVIVIGSTHYRVASGGRPPTTIITGEEPPNRLDVQLARQKAGIDGSFS